MTSFTTLLAQQDFGGDFGGADAAAGGMSILSMIVSFAMLAGVIVGMYKVFEKAGKPGWAAIVPIYNLFVLTEIAGLSIIWFVMYLVCCIAIIPAVVVPLNIAKAFGKSTSFGIGLMLLPFIFYPVLGFSDAKYLGAPAK